MGSLASSTTATVRFPGASSERRSRHRRARRTRMRSFATPNASPPPQSSPECRRAPPWRPPVRRIKHLETPGGEDRGKGLDREVRIRSRRMRAPGLPVDSSPHSEISLVFAERCAALTSPMRLIRTDCADLEADPCRGTTTIRTAHAAGARAAVADWSMRTPCHRRTGRSPRGSHPTGALSIRTPRARCAARQSSTTSRQTAAESSSTRWGRRGQNTRAPITRFLYNHADL